MSFSNLFLSQRNGGSRVETTGDFLPPPTDAQKEIAGSWFEALQLEICAGLEALEAEFDPAQPGGKFQTKLWDREGVGLVSGGGRMMVSEGRLFEKAGIATSRVFGEFSPKFCERIPGTEKSPEFWASGTSLVIHPRSPYVPIIHMNTRHISTGKSWFGGGIDLTPTLPNDEDTAFFHGEMRKVCDAFDPQFYSRFKAWADAYFFIPHRGEPRGVGGIFYDYIGGEQGWEGAMEFSRAVGRAFVTVYGEIVRRRWNTPWGEAEQEALAKKRSRYVEFNLLYDRGTLFGLQTGGYTEAILMPLPPHASWPSPLRAPLQSSLQPTNPL